MCSGRVGEVVVSEFFLTKIPVFRGGLFFYKLIKNPNLTKIFFFFFFFFFGGGGGGGGKGMGGVGVSVRT